MAIDRDLEVALEALSRREGKSKDELLRDLLGDRLRSAASGERESIGDATGSRALARRGPSEVARQEFPGTPVVRSDVDDGLTPEEAQERWYESETNLPDGVHGLGGQSAGGIFGDSPVATSIYDPQAMSRAEQRASGALHVRLIGLVERLEARVTAHEQKALEGGNRRQLRGRGQR